MLLPCRSPPYPLPSARPLSVCTRIYSVYESTCPYCVFRAFPCSRGFFPCASALSGSRSPGISHRSSGKWFSNWAASARKGYRRSALVTMLPSAFPLCSQLPLESGTFPGGKWCPPSQMQIPALYTGKTVFFGVIFHVLNAAHLFAKLACLLLVIVGGLYESRLAILLQV